MGSVSVIGMWEEIAQSLWMVGVKGKARQGELIGGRTSEMAKEKIV